MAHESPSTAAAWISTYAGKDIVRGYRRWFHVDKLCALVELRLCGVPISEDRIKAVQQEQERLHEKRLERKAMQSLEQFIEQDDHFACIIGYTSGGAPYGVTWKETVLLPPLFSADRNSGQRRRHD